MIPGFSRAVCIRLVIEGALFDSGLAQKNPQRHRSRKRAQKAGLPRFARHFNNPGPLVKFGLHAFLMVLLRIARHPAYPSVGDCEQSSWIRESMVAGAALSGLKTCLKPGFAWTSLPEYGRRHDAIQTALTRRGISTPDTKSL